MASPIAIAALDLRREFWFLAEQFVRGLWLYVPTFAPEYCRQHCALVTRFFRVRVCSPSTTPWHELAAIIELNRPIIPSLRARFDDLVVDLAILV